MQQQTAPPTAHLRRAQRQRVWQQARQQAQRRAPQPLPLQPPQPLPLLHLQASQRASQGASLTTLQPPLREALLTPLTLREAPRT